MYLKIKKMMDSFLSAVGLILLSPLFCVLIFWIKFDSRGPVLFKQKRIGLHKKPFYILKFRTMRIDTPKDMPTHLLANPEQYITKAGRFLRKTSLDELPQIINILFGDMSIIGPRPALWNQYDLIAERDKYGANDVLPGLTGWAQINGRDELEIPVKAKLDGEYVRKLQKGGLGGFFMDCRCFFGTIVSVLHHDGVVEGGTGEMKRQKQESFDMPAEDEISPKAVENQCEKAEPKKMKRVLITGANSYIGMSFESWAAKLYPGEFRIDTVDMVDGSWREKSFAGYDAVFHVAGIAHADIGKVTEEQKAFYYKINRDLAIETAQKAKVEGVRQFVFMSSMIVYSGCKEKVINCFTEPKPLNFYGDSKWQADQEIQKLGDGNFKVVVLRPPMIYGKGSKGNYPKLSKLVAKVPIFPVVRNKRSVLHIDNLCEFIKLMIENEEAGIFFPQNKEYVATSELVYLIAKVREHKIIMVRGFSGIIKLMAKIPGKIGRLAEKAFGDSAYDLKMSEYKYEYRINSTEETIKLTEK